MRTELDERLRERWISADDGAADLEAARVELQRRQAEDDGSAVAASHVGRAHQRLSEACRFSGLLDDALTHKDAALEIWRASNKQRATFLVRLQRALVLAELGDARAADEMAELQDQMVGDPDLEPYYTDFWLEYEACRLLWEGDGAGAEQRLLEALRFRVDHRAARAVEWTEEALRKLRGGRESV